MTHRALISTALARTQAYYGDIIVALCRAVDERSDSLRREYLSDARDDAMRVVNAIDDAMRAEQPVEKVA